jgi:hypothetical protein
MCYIQKTHEVRLDFAMSSVATGGGGGSQYNLLRSGDLEGGAGPDFVVWVFVFLGSVFFLCNM